MASSGVIFELQNYHDFVMLSPFNPDSGATIWKVTSRIIRETFRSQKKKKKKKKKKKGDFSFWRSGGDQAA
jgi:hypothetical protein